MRASASVRGRATGTRECDVLSLRHLVPEVNAVFLTGGSAFGLGATDGAVQWLAERKRGFSVGVGVVPIVPAAVVFDLAPIGRSDRWPTADDGYAACAAAGRTVAEGSVGVGTGATVGKALGAGSAMKGGLGTWSERRGELIVAALAVVNAFGDVRDDGGQILAGARGPAGFLDARRYLADGGEPGGSFARTGTNTTLVVVGTNAVLDREDLAGVAHMAADAVGQRVTPAGTRYDGDVIFAVSTSRVTGTSAIGIEVLAQAATARAIERAVLLAKGTDSVPGLGAPGGRLETA